MDTKKLLKNIAIFILSSLFFIVAPIAINLYILKDFSIENALTDVSSASAKNLVNSQLDSMCKNQTMVSFGDCKTMLLKQMCLSTQGCSTEKITDVDAFVDAYVAPGMVAQAMNLTVAESGIRVRDIQPMISDYLNIASIITITLILLLLLLIRNAREAMKIFGTNLFWVGISLVFAGFFLSEIFPSVVFDTMQKAGIDENTILAIYQPVSVVLKPVINSEYQFGIIISLAGSLMALFAHFFMKQQRN